MRGLYAHHLESQNRVLSVKASEIKRELKILLSWYSGIAVNIPVSSLLIRHVRQHCCTKAMIWKWRHARHRASGSQCLINLHSKRWRTRNELFLALPKNRKRNSDRIYEREVKKQKLKENKLNCSVEYQDKIYGRSERIYGGIYIS